MLKIPFRILGKRWSLKLYSKKEYKGKFGKDSLALTKGHKRSIYLSPLGMDKTTIIHELVHAYLYEMCLSSSEINATELEEVFAEMVAHRGEEMLDLVDSLLLKMRNPI